ncbi:MAG TPA: glycosyltransferase family 39 protein [Methylomirabilota bacterium]|nr:glycosyltransferase family 39 protein [Methylomirabilota bacterium]
MHAEIGRELLASGDPLRLTLGGVRYVDKPPLLYAMLAGAFALGGLHEATARLVPALAALAAVAATAGLGARLLGVRWGLLAGVALLGSGSFYAYGRYLRPETLFVAALAAGFALTLSGLADGRRGRAAVGMAFFGLAALAKDPLGALLPPLAVGLALAASGRARPLGRWLPWPGVAALLVVGLGWYAAAAVATPGFAAYTALDNHVLNVARARQFPDEDVPLGAGEFLLVAAVGAAPWVLAAAAAVARLVRRRAWRDSSEAPWLALALWAVGVLALTTLSPFRLPHYGLPAYPALALLAARAWRDAGRGLTLAHASAFAALATACGVAWAARGAPLAAVLAATDVATRKALAAGSVVMLDPAAFTPLLGVAAVAFAAGALVLGALATRPRAPHAAAATVALTVLAVLPCVASGLQIVSTARTVKSVALELARRVSPGDVVAHEGPIENSGALEWYSGLRPVIVDGWRSVLGFGATRPESRDVFWDAARLLGAWTGPERVWLVTGRAEERSMASALPGARLVVEADGRRLYVNR